VALARLPSLYAVPPSTSGGGTWSYKILQTSALRRAPCNGEIVILDGEGYPRF
jgi:hypothetical protein